METTIEYASGYAAITRPVPRYGPWGLIRGQSPSGYGSKIPTDYMVRFTDHPRLHRVYCICYSNAGSLYVIKGGKRLYLKEYELEDALDR